MAHPDDEVLGCGALLSRLRDVRVIHVTDGAPRDGVDAARHGFASPAGYADRRRQEALAALALAGVPPGRVIGLRVADQGAAEAMAATVRQLVPLLAGAELLLTHSFEGGHPDHDAVAFVARAACGLLGGAAPAIAEMPFYFGDDAGWVRQCFLPHPDAGPTLAITLDEDARALKTRMAAAHATQGDVLAGFTGDVERFRAAPAHDFTRRPHEGPLLYERHGWGLTWAGWLAHVHAADAALRNP